MCVGDLGVARGKSGLVVGIDKDGPCKLDLRVFRHLLLPTLDVPQRDRAIDRYGFTARRSVVRFFLTQGLDRRFALSDR